MASIAWTWSDFWSWYEQIEEQDRKNLALKELNSGNWLKSLSSDSQAKVFMDAPMEIKLQLKQAPTVIRRETLLLLQAVEDKKNKKFKRKDVMSMFQRR